MRQDSGEHHGDQDPALDVAHHERHGQQQPHHERERGPAEQLTAVAQLHGNRGVRGVRDAPHEARVDETDERDEQPDAHHDRGLEGVRHGVEHGGAEAGEHQDHHDHAGPDDQSHDLRPREPGVRGDRHGQERVHAQARGDAERGLGPQPHEDGQHAGHERGHGRDAFAAQDVARAVLAVAQDERVEHHDVAHGDERGHATPDLTTHGGAATGDREVAVQSASWFGPGGWRSA